MLLSVKFSRRLLLLLLLTCLIPGLSSSQIRYERNKINPDSLIQAIPNMDILSRVDAYNKIALARFGYTADSIFTLSGQAIEISDSIRYAKGKANGFFNLGNAFYMQDDIKQAVIYYLQALKVYENTEPCTEMGLTYYALSVINWQAGRSREAIEYAHKESLLFKQLGNYKNMIVGLFIIGAYYNGINEIDSAEHYYSKAVRLLHDYPDTSHLIMEYNHLASLMIKKGYQDTLNIDDHLKKCLHYCRMVIRLLDLYPFNSNATAKYSADAYYRMARCYLNGFNGDSVTKGIQCTDKSIEIANKQGLFLNIIRNNNIKGDYYLNNNNINKAIELYQKAIDSSYLRWKQFSLNKFYINDPYDYKYTTQYVFNSSLQYPYKNLYNCYIKLGDYENALKYYMLWQQIKNEIFQSDNNNLIAALEAESENEKTENLIARLESDRQISELRASQLRSFTFGLGLFALVIIVLSLLFIRQNKIKNEHRNTLLEQKLLRLQMNPHFIFNALSSIHSLMNPRNVDRASAYLGNFSRLLRSTLESSREDYILLEEEIKSIKNYLEVQSLRFENKFKYHIDVDPKIGIDTAIIPPMFIQPFIENAIEHGIRHKKEKGNINIRFRLQNNKIICEIKDDGIGRKKAWETKYAEKAKHKSMATDIIEERIKILNRKFKQKISLDIIDLMSETKSAKGTLVRLNLPLILD